VKPIAKTMTSLRLNNEKEIRDGRPESGRSERLDNVSNGSNCEEKEVKEKKFGFTLRRSRVAEEGKDNKSPQNGFSLKNNPSNAVTPTNSTGNVSLLAKQEIKTVKIDEKSAALNIEDNLSTPFKLKLKEPPKEAPEKTLVSSIVKKVEPEKGLFFNKTPHESRLAL
jgi:hypothetical protein